MPPRVLVVDDEPLLLRSLARMLERAGYEVVAVSTVAAAGAALHADPFDVVVTDLRLGTTTGLDLIRIAGALTPAPGVIVFSGAAAPEDVDAATDAGAHAILRKPLQPADLLAAVAAAIRAR